MNILLFNDGGSDRVPVRVISDSPAMHDMICEVLSERYDITDGAAALTVVCVRGEAPHFRGPGIVIGEREEVSNGIIYLPRPLDIRRFAAAVKYLTEGAVEHTEYGYVVDSVRRSVSLGDRETRLTQKEMELFCLLSQRCGEAVSKEDIKNALWSDAEENSNICAVYVSYLRKKLETVAGHGAVASVGGGYMLCDPRGFVR